MGIEPTPRAAAARGNGFEDRESHQAPSASAPKSITRPDTGAADLAPSQDVGVGPLALLARSLPVRAALLALGVAIAYGGALTAGVAWDDTFLVSSNPAIRSLDSPLRFFTDRWTLSPTGGNNLAQYRPLRTLLYALEFAVFGGSAWGFHLVSIVLHAVAAGLLGAFTVALFGHGGWLAATIWLFHPALSENALYLAAQGNLLCLIFALLAALAHVRWLESGSGRWRVGAALALLGAMAAYEVGILVPALLVIVEAVWRWRGGRRAGALIAPHVPYWVVTAAFIALRSAVVDAVPRPPWWEGSWTAALLAQLRIWLEAWRLTLLPTSQLVRYMPSDAPAWASAPLAVIVHIGLAAFAVIGVFLPRRRLAAACVAWWYLAQAFTSNVIVTNLGYLFAPRFLFLALVLPVAAFAAWAQRRASPRALATAAALASVAAMPALRHQVAVWQGPISVNSEIIRANPNDFGGHYTLGWSYLLCRDDRRARHHLEVARNLAPSFAATYYLLGELHLREGAMRPAHLAFKRNVELAPTIGEPRARLAEIAMVVGEREAAREWLVTIGDISFLEPFTRARIELTLARVEFALGDCRRAGERAARAAELLPPTPDVPFEAGALLSYCGDVARGHELLARASEQAGRHYHDRVGDFGWLGLGLLEPIVPLTPRGRFGSVTAPVVGP